MSGMASAPPARDHRLDDLRSRVGDALRIDPVELDRLSRDASRVERAGRPFGAVVARDARDVAAALSWATRHGVPVSVRGAGTGFAGGAVAYDGGIVVSLERLTRILGVDEGNRLIDVEAGVVTAGVDRAAAAHGLMYAPDPASLEQSTIGGNIATNAGGLRCLKYGVTLESVAALEVVLPTGEIVELGSRTRKNAVGLSLAQLMVGSEGVLGVVTRATLRLHPRPEGEPVTFRASFSALETAGIAVEAVSSAPVVPEILELMDRATVAAVRRRFPESAEIGECAALLVGRIVGPTAQQDARRLEDVLRRAGADEVAFATGDGLLDARRLSSRALTAEGLRVSSDVAVPVSRLAEMFARIERIEAETGVRIPTFAHAGDGNLHPSVIVGRGDRERDDGIRDAATRDAEDAAEERARAEHVLELVTRAALELGGTASGEHGVGSLKLHALEQQLSPEVRALQERVKRAFDPAGILSPGRAI